MNLGRELRADVREGQLHQGGLGTGQHQPDGTVARRAAGAADISIVVARVDGHRRTGSFRRPAMRAAPFLPDAGFVLAPQFNGFVGMRGGQALQRDAEFF